MNKKYVITFWHGRDENLRKKLLAINCWHDEGTDDLLFDGTLNEFAEKYGEHFQFYPKKALDPQFNYDGMIAVTRHSSFSQR